MIVKRGQFIVNIPSERLQSHIAQLHEQRRTIVLGRGPLAITRDVQMTNYSNIHFVIRQLPQRTAFVLSHYGRAEGQLESLDASRTNVTLFIDHRMTVINAVINVVMVGVVITAFAWAFGATFGIVFVLVVAILTNVVFSAQLIATLEHDLAFVFGRSIGDR